MTLKHTPKPLIEEHYHIQELINSQEKRHEDRITSRNKKKSIEERDGDIHQAKPFVQTDFWCDTCKKDFKSQSIKQIEDDWNADQRIAFYKAKCHRGHWAIRHITDREKDGFNYKSKLLALDRGNHHNDTVQPWESGFQMLYGRKNT